MIILAYYECVIRVLGDNGKVYEYTDVLPLQYRMIQRFLKHKRIGKAWQFLRSKDCYVIGDRR